MLHVIVSIVVLIAPVICQLDGTGGVHTMSDGEQSPELFEGDIVNPPKDLIQSPGSADGAVHKRGLVYNYRWPNGVVPLGYIKQAMDHIHAKTCIRFVSKTPTDAHWVDITNNNNDVAKCFVYYLGRSTELGGQQLNLADDCFQNHFGTAIHELMHTIGFIHEHNRRDRDQYIEILEENIAADARDQFQSYESSYQTADTPYDYGSIMHYGEYAGQSHWWLRTIRVKKRGVTIGQRNGLSEIDVKEINELYECDKNRDTCADIPKGTGSVVVSYNRTSGKLGYPSGTVAVVKCYKVDWKCSDKTLLYVKGSTQSFSKELRLSCANGAWSNTAVFSCVEGCLDLHGTEGATTVTYTEGRNEGAGVSLPETTVVIQCLNQVHTYVCGTNSQWQSMTTKKPPVITDIKVLCQER